MREIKFRAWDDKMKRWLPFNREYPLKIAEKPLVKDFVKLMQYTGLIDKNGKEIYEGDIIVARDISGSGQERVFQPREVYWDKQLCGFNITESISDDSSYEIIGNIYKNPELLKN